VNQMKFIVDAA